MEFSPHNNVVRLCLQGMESEAKNHPEEAKKIFRQAWDEAENDFEKFIAAHYITRHQQNAADKLQWIETSLQLALKIDSDYARGNLSSLYLKKAQCYEESGDTENAKKNYESAESFKH